MIDQPQGLPRAPLQDFVLITVPVQYEALSNMAAKHNMTVHDLILRAVDDYILKLEGRPHANPDSGQGGKFK